MAMEWEYKIDSSSYYAGACMTNDFLLVAYSRGDSRTYFDLVWTETGTSWLHAASFPGDFAGEVVSMESAGEFGVYALVRSGLEEYSVCLINVEIDDPLKTQLLLLATKKLPGITGELSENFKKYPPTKLHLYYSDTDLNRQIPGVILTAHREGNEGLLIYGFAHADKIQEYAYNPFAHTASNGNVHIPESAVLKCQSGLFENFVCLDTDNCNNFFYKTEGNTCARCHHTCAKCTGPLATQCLSCRNSNANVNTELAQCFPDTVDSNSLSPIANPIYRFGYPRDACPPYAFDLGDFGEIFGGSDDAAFYSLSNSCVKLPGPSSAAGANEFTISLWAKVKVASNEVFISVFGNLKLVALTSGIEIRLPNLPSGTHSIEHDWSSFNWAFISVSLKNSALGYKLTPFVTQYLSSTEKFLVASYTTTSPVPLVFNSGDNFIQIGCKDATNFPITEGYLRDLSFIPKYLTREEMSALRSVTYTSDLQISSLISFWPFDKLASNTPIRDVTGSLTAIVTATNITSNVDDAEELKLAKQYGSRLGIVGRCFDLFGYSKLPAFSFDTLDFAGNELQQKMNLNSYVHLGAVIRSKDALHFTHGGCDSTALGYKLLCTAKVMLQANGKVKLVQSQRLPAATRGTYVDSCYCGTRGCAWLGRTYFPLLPTQIHPAHGVSDGDAAPLKFELKGGDQSYGDKLTLVNIEKDVATGTGETIIVDERDIGYPAYSAVRRVAGEYEELATTSLDRSVYTVAWRPSYMSYLVDERNVVYKNLYTTWTLQGAPRVRFPPLAGVPGVFKNTVEYKGEYFYLDTVGAGQADGDQIIFCTIGCNYFNMQGENVFQRENGRYPPIQFGEDVRDGVGGLARSSVLVDRLYICWRPAARGISILPEDDLWTALENSHRPGTYAYVILNALSTNALKREILQLSLPIKEFREKNIVTAPILFQGDTIWFEVSGSGYTSTGIVQIAHVVYDSYDRSSYTLEAIWEETTNNGLQKLDEQGGKHILQEIPYSAMKAGHDYMLIIYSNTFVNLGRSDSTPQPQFKYLFRYQEAAFEEPKSKKLAPVINDITIRGSNLGTVSVRGNNFVETRKLFGVAVSIDASPPCSQPIRASYIPGTLDDNPAAIELKDVDLTRCGSVDELTVNVRLLKIADGHTEALWSVTNSSKSLRLGAVGCDDSCATCSGPSSFDCLSCKGNYLHKGRCLSSCGGDLPLASAVFKGTSSSVEYYVCTRECKPGYYRDEKLGLCVECSFECATCSSGKPMACTSCKGMPVSDTESKHNYMNFYEEAYYFKGMCLLECPSIINGLTEIPASGKEVIIINNVNHTCDINPILVNASEMEVQIQSPTYTERINIKKSIQLRAILNDKRNPILIPISAEHSWSSHPAEDLTNKDLYTSDRRTFQNYTDNNLKQAITTLNMNAFNYKSENDQMRVIVRAWDDKLKLFNFDMIELFSNRPPEVEEANVKIIVAEGPAAGQVVTSNTKLSTMSTINIDIGGIQDNDDYYSTLKFKVLLVPRSLLLPDPLPDTAITPESALLLLAQLPGHYLTLYSSREVQVNVDGSARLKNIYIPPLVNGKQVISSSDAVSSEEVSADLYLHVEDRHLGVTKAKFIVKIKETYVPKMRETIRELLKVMTDKVKKKTFSWDDALRIAHVFRAVNPEHRQHYMSFTKCSRDDQCGERGKCSTSGGWSECICDSSHVGDTCSWEMADLINEQQLVNAVMNHLNVSLLTLHSARPAPEMTDTNLIDQIANVLIGLLKNPEVVDGKYLDDVVDLVWYMTRIDQFVGGRMDEFERNNVFAAIDAAIKYVYYRLRGKIHKYYTLGEEVEDFTVEQKAEYAEMRTSLVGTVKKLRESLYNVVDAGSLVQYPSSVPYAVEYDTFEILIASQLEDKLFATLKDRVGLQLAAGKEYIWIPPSLLKTLRTEVSKNEEFKFRIIKWKENPYVFSEFSTEVCTPVYNFAVLDSNDKVIPAHLQEPVVFFLPVSGFTKNLPSNSVRCMHFNIDHTAKTVTIAREKINVNQLELTDEEKTALYPEWRPEFYHSKNLIIEQTTFAERETAYPEFEDLGGIASYGNILKTTEYKEAIPCAVYSSAEIAAVAERRPAHRRRSYRLDFSYDYDPLTSIYMNVGTYVCVVLGSLFVASLVAASVADSLLLPKHISLMMGHRCSEADVSNRSGQAIPSVFSTSEDGSDGRDDYAKLSVDISLPRKTKKKHGRARAVHRVSGRPSDNTIDNSSSTISAIRNKEASLEEKQENSQQDASTVKALRQKISVKDASSTATLSNNLSTIHGMVDSSGNWSSSDPQKTTIEESSLKEIFRNYKPGELALAREKHGNKHKDVFNKKHKELRTAQEYHFSNVYFNANLLLNIVTRTSTSFSRLARTFVLYSQIYFLMFWSASLIASSAQKLTHPEQEKDVMFLVSSKVWIMFVSPVISSVTGYLVAGMFKVSERRIQEATTVERYKQVM